MAWHLTLDPPRLTALPFPPAPPASDTAFATRHGLASPDGKSIYTCTSDTQPVLRDATTLAIIRAYPGAGCFSPTFTDNNHLVWRDEGTDRSLDLATGKSVALDRNAVTVRPGPGALRLEVNEGRAKLFDGTRKIRAEQADSYVDEVHWNARYAVAEHFQTITIYPLDPSADVRKVELPEIDTLVALGDTLALAISGRSILRIDLSSGRMQKPSANLASIGAVAPRGGSVLASSDKVRVWRDGKVVGTTDSAAYIGVGSASAPVALLDYDKLDMWTPETNDRERVQELKFAQALARDGDTLVVVSFERLFRGTTSSSLESWHVLRDDVSVQGIDVRNERLALELKDASHVVDLKARTVWSFSLDLYGDKSSCSTASELVFSPDGTRLLSTRRGIILLDTAKRTATELDLDDSYMSATVLKTGEVIAVGRKRIALWDPTSQKAIGWSTELGERPVRIGVSPDDTELAIAYADGRIWWVDIRGLRKHATPVESKLVPITFCDVKPASYESLVVE
jgi:WD40 repeat protein